MNPSSVFGFAQAAGKLTSGDGAVERVLRRGDVSLLVLADDAGEATARRYERLAGRYDVSLLRWGAKAELGMWIGERPRAVLALCDPHFANMLTKAVAGSGKQLR